MLIDNFSTVKGIRVSFSPEIAAEIMEFPLEEEKFSNTLDAVSARTQFIVHTDPWLQID